MDTNNSQELLTPSAKDALDVIISEYEQRILSDASLRAISLPTGEKEISARDILASADYINNHRLKNRSKRTEMVLRIYSLIGIMVALVGIAFLFYGKLGYILTPRDQWIIIIIFSGLFIGILPIFYRKYSSAFEQNQASISNSIPDTSLLFLIKWNEIEEVIRKNINSASDKSIRKPISFMLKDIQEQGSLNQADSMAIRNLLSLRNDVVHKTHSVSNERLTTAIEEANKLLSKLGNQR